jgi:hypothetical protein
MQPLRLRGIEIIQDNKKQSLTPDALAGLHAEGVLPAVLHYQVLCTAVMQVVQAVTD